MKKLLSVALVLIMMLSVFSVTASAEATVGYYDVRVGDVYYEVYEDEAYAIGYDIDIDSIVPAGAITIPETITYRGDKYTVVGIETEAFYQSLFTSITLPSTISYIGDYAFSTSDYLEEVVIPSDCYFDYFGLNVFVTTPFEAEIYSKDETIFGENVLYSYIGNADEYVIPEDINILANNCFFMSGVKSVVFNDNIAEIPYYAFASCRNLKEITIPDSVWYIDEGAFKDCTSLEKVTLGDGVTTLGADCFANTKLKSIHLGPNVESTTATFRNCNSLEVITVDEENPYYTTDENALYFDAQAYYEELFGSLLEELEFDYNFGYFLEYYYPFKAKGTVTIKPEVTVISACAFYGCKDLKEIVAGTVEVDTYAFANSGIEKFSATNLTYVWDYAFRNCKNLTDIDLSDVVYFGSSAFENCTSLTDVSFNEDVNNIGELAFANTGLKNVTIYGDDCYIYESAFKGCKELESVRLEEGVSYVGMNAFLDCPKLKTIYLSKTVQYFEDNAFNGCDSVTFELIKNTKAYKYIKNNTDYNIEVVGNYSLWQRIIDFFKSLFGIA